MAEGDDSDICEPLSTSVVCQSLNDSESLCQPSQWAGDAIQDAINATQVAMRELQRSLHTRRAASGPPAASRDSSSGLKAATGDKVTASGGTYFRVWMVIAGQVVYVVAVGLLVSAAHAHLRRYTRSDLYNNCYVSDQFRVLDERYCKATGSAPLLPLRAHECPYIADVSAWPLAAFERQYAWRGSAVFVLTLLVGVAVVGFDLLVYWLLVVVTTHAVADNTDNVPFPARGSIVDELTAAFADDGFRSDSLWPPLPYTVDPAVCLPSPSPPSDIVLLPLVVLLVFLAVGGVILSARCRRMRARITGYYYPERGAERAVYLYGVMTSRRRRVPRLTRTAARRRAGLNRRATVMAPAVPRLPSCWGRSKARRSCLVCAGGGQLIACRRPSSSRSGVETSCCLAVYCAECWEDLGRVCAVCQYPPQTSGKPQDMETSVDLQDVDYDQLQMLCATNWQ